MKVRPPDSNVEWKAWAQKDPLYAVATCPDKDRDGARPWTDDEFYALGLSDWQDFHSRWNQYGIDHISCVEIGCGAGRLTKHMARDFGTVYAMDISPDMLDYARKHVVSKNVEFHLTTGADLPVFDATISAVFSCHVFQHFDSLDVARMYFLEAYRVLAPTGSLMIHVPLYCWPSESWTYSALHAAQTRIADTKAALNRRLINAGFFRPLMRRLAYPLEWLFSELHAIGFENVELATIALKSTGDPHTLVLARK
jgi:ubiquinone/menaquinone biosynthesis C-methylase UbiE